VSGFVQIIEWKTSRIDEIRQLQKDWRERFPAMGPSRVLLCSDRDDEAKFLTIVEFASYEEAMKNSADPATSEFAERMMALCDGPPVFHNLDVLDEENR
jgi:hypothetical protein